MDISFFNAYVINKSNKISERVILIKIFKHNFLQKGPKIRHFRQKTPAR